MEHASFHRVTSRRGTARARARFSVVGYRASVARSAQLALLLGLAAVGAGCGLVYDLSKLGPGADDAGSGDAADAAVVDAVPPTCPSRRGSPMIGAASFCIDARETTNAQYAAYLADTKKTGKRPTLPPTCNFKEELTPGSVVPAEAELPVRNVDWCDALSYCLWADKRLCGKVGGGGLRRIDATDPAASEWARACTKGGTRPLPYGPTYEAGRCHVPGDAAAPLPAASQCAGGLDGLLDMVGNVAEWIDACETADGEFAECEVLGGSFLSSGAEATCASIAPAARSAKRPDQGIRCCGP